MKPLSPDQFISQLYREAPLIPLNEFAAWALDLLRRVIPFDGGIWGTGHHLTRKFHTQTTVDVSPQIFHELLRYSEINPIVEKLIASQGKAISMNSILNDEQFYQSELYQVCFKPFGIERILSTIHLDERSGIFDLLTLYRYDREHRFTKQEERTQSRLLFHLFSCASHRQLQELNQGNMPACSSNNIDYPSALVDKQGTYHAVTQQFLDILEAEAPEQPTQQFPFEFIQRSEGFTTGNLTVEVKQFGELYKLSLRAKSPFDDLTQREKQVIDGICQGNTFKQIAKKLSLSPSTVSNHLYRIYLKLGVHTRSELVEQVNTNHPELLT